MIGPSLYLGSYPWARTAQPCVMPVHTDSPKYAEWPIILSLMGRPMSALLP